ncbi:transcription factor TFIIIB component B'' homolog isoform X3 [Siniperca chuatsi]|uniref:transcription factor TFIIIB component B'' homolog isoform X3 n=1 Tax=Siniperca chuatsi TaxID=119488 RepID=UPI001CE10B40|nr:transcription factor TFIIIB component B'' homolog isoform X3 [Siniperca chuatsi]
MFRRSRFSIRPNVGTAGRTAATPQEAPSVNQEASETPKDISESSTDTAVTDNKSVVNPSEKPTAPGDGNDQNGEGTSSSAAVQRRKRFSIKPKVAPGRPSTLARTPKSPVKAVSETPVEVPSLDLDKPTTSSQTGTAAAPQGLQSPRRQRPSEESKQPKVQPKPTLISSDSLGPLAIPPAEDSLEQTHLPADSSKQLESTSGSQVKEVPSRLPDKVPPSLPDKEAIEISEKAKTLVSKSGLSLSPPAFSLSRLLNDPSDLQRLAKARKLRELLRQEMHKEKKIKKSKARAKEYTLDPAKMTMRDLIRYLPVSNPMTSSLEDSAQENETVIPPSPGREESPERAQEPVVPPKIASPREEEEEEAEEEQEEALMVPQVKVAEDGSLIIDEESLTVEVLRAKGPNPAQDRDPVFERGSTTTYSSFRKGTYSKPWSSEETDMFFLAVSMVGTDFSMICQLFPHRARSEIKNKFKKEERENAWRIDKAFRERRKLDIEYFSKLLEKILEVQKNRKKLKSLAEKNSPKKHKRKAKGKKASKKLSDVEEEDEEEENEIPDLEGEEGEKENEDLCNEGGTPISKPKKKRKRNDRQEASTEEPNDKKNKTGDKSNEKDEAYIPEDAEAALPEDRTNSDMSEKTETVNAAKDTAIKPAKLSRGRAPKPVLPLGRKWGKKPPTPSTKAKDTVSDKGDESVSDGASKEQVDKDTSPLRQANKRKSANDDISSEEEDATVQPPRPTRYGRVPKPTKPLTYPAKEDAHSSAFETTPASPAGSTASAARPKPKCTAKRGRSSKPQSAQESKKPKLVTLRASQSEYSDEDNEKQWEEEEVEEEQHPACSSSKDSIAPVFVPASLRSPHPMISEVEETMEELDILANMPDVLGISQDALCPDASFELAQNDTAEPCEHQLDLLVDVIDFLSSEQTEASEDESYNEAAQTLLTIGNLAHLSQSAQNQIAIQDHMTGTASVSVNETSQHLEEEIASKLAAQEENSVTPHMSATSGHGFTETSETVATVELQSSTTDNSEMDPTPQLQSSPESPKKNSSQTRRGRLSKVKPKPNLGQASRTAQSKSQPETTVRTAEESHTVAPDLSQATETLSAAKVTPKIADCSQKLLKDDISSIEVKLTEEPSGSQERSVGQVKSGAAISDQSASENQGQPILELATRDSRSTSESIDEILISHVGTTKSSCNNLVTFDPAVTELQIGQGTNIDSAPVQESSSHPASCVTPVEDLLVSQKEESEDAPTHQARKSRFQKVKPNLAQTSRTVHSNPVDICKNAEELPVSQKEESEVTCQTRRGRLQKVKPKPNLPQTSTVRSKPQTTKDPVTHMQLVEKPSNPSSRPESTDNTIAEVEAWPTCSTTPPEKPSQSTGTASVLVQSLELCSTHKPTEEFSSTEDQKTDTGSAQDSEQNVPQRRQRFPKVKPKPNLGSSTRTTQAKLQSNDISKPSEQLHRDTSSNVTSEQQSVDNKNAQTELKLAEKDSKHLTSPHCSLHTELPSSTKLGSAESEKSLDSTNDKGTSSDGIVTALSCVAENQSMLTESVLENKRSEKPTVEEECTQDKTSKNDMVEAGPASQWDCKQYLSIRATETNTQPTDVPTAISDVQSSEDGSTELKIKPILSTNTQSSPDPKESTQQPCSENDSKAQSQDVVHQCSETTEINQITAQSSDDNQAEQTDSSKSSRKAPQTRRGRLVKPKPNLGRSSQPPQPRQVHNTKQAEADCGTRSEGADASVSHKPVSELRPDIQEPVEGAIEQRSNHNSPSNDAGPSLGCLTQAPGNSTQDASTSITGENQSLTIFPDILSEQVPSDPDEPFFILSLTEIPVCSSGEVVDSVSVPPPYLPVTDASIQQQSVLGESLAAAGDGPLSNDAVPVSMEESGETGLINVKDIGPDPAAYIGLIMENPVDPYESTTVQSSKLPETVENNDETEIPPTKQMDTGRGAKLQVKPNTTRKKQARETLAAREAESIPIQTNTTQDLELPGPSVQSEAVDEVVTEPQKQSDHVDTEKETLTSGKHPEDSSTGAQTKQTRGASSRKPKGIPSEKSNTAPSSDSPPGKAASKGSKVKTPRAARKRSTPAPVPSTSYDVTPTPNPTMAPEETRSTFSPTSPTQTEVHIEQTSEHSQLCSDPTSSTSQCTAEVSASQQSDGVESSSIEEEPTSVSQYFLSDIFTEVEEG